VGKRPTLLSHHSTSPIVLEPGSGVSHWAMTAGVQVPILFSSGPVDGWNPFLPGHAGAQHTGGVDSHLRALREQAAGASRLAAPVGQPPVPIAFFNLHSGHDSWGFSKSREYLRQVGEVEAVVGAPCVHEIHRGRLTYSPWVRSPETALRIPTAQH
jgi:hypothetical protein